MTLPRRKRIRHRFCPLLVPHAPPPPVQSLTKATIALLVLAALILAALGVVMTEL